MIKAIIKIALIQNPQSRDKQETLSTLEKLIGEAAENKAEYVFLAECFNSLYRKDELHANAEDFSSPTAPTINLLIGLILHRKFIVKLL